MVIKVESYRVVARLKLTSFHSPRTSCKSCSCAMFSGPKFDPSKDLADLSGKVIVVTGAK